MFTKICDDGTTDGGDPSLDVGVLPEENIPELLCIRTQGIEYAYFLKGMDWFAIIQCLSA